MMAWFSAAPVSDVSAASLVLSELFGTPVRLLAYSDKAAFSVVFGEGPPKALVAQVAVDAAWERNRA